MPRKQLNEEEFQKMTKGKKLTQPEEAILRQVCGLPHNKTLVPPEGVLYERLWMRAWKKIS
jgi:hypothetical protein